MNKGPLHIGDSPKTPPAMSDLPSGIRGPGAGLSRDQKAATLNRLQEIEDELQGIVDQYHGPIPAITIKPTAEISIFKRAANAIFSLFDAAPDQSTPFSESPSKPNLPELVARIQLLREEYESLKSQCDAEMQRTLEIPKLAEIREGIFQQVGDILFEANSGTLQPSPGPANIYSFYSHFHLDNLPLTPDKRKKLKEMMTDANYKRACQAALELQPNCKLPTQEYIIAQLLNLPLKQLKNICGLQEKPTLLIVPPASFDDKVIAMNANKHYNHAKGQDNAYVNPNANSPYKNAPTMTMGKISIADGIIHPKPPQSGVSTKLGLRRDYYDGIFTAKNLGHIDKDEYAVLMQMSLIEAQQANNHCLIIDHLEDWRSTTTFLNLRGLTNTGLVAYAYFNSDIRQVRFYADPPDDVIASARARSSVQVGTFMA